MAERALQRNNGSPRGYGQPRRRGVDPSVIMDDQANQVYGERSEGVNDQSGQDQIAYAHGKPQVMRGYEPVESSTGSGRFGRGAAGFDAFGQSPEAQRAYGNAPQDSRTADVRNQLTGQATANPQYQPGMTAMQMYGTGDIEAAKGIQRGQVGALEGFNTQGWETGERGSSSIKNTFGKIASRYDHSQPGALRAVVADPEFQMHFPMARIVEHPNGDLIDFGDGMPVDVLRGAVAGGAGQAWVWQPSNGASPSSPGMPGPAAQAYAAPFPQQGQPGPAGAAPEVFDESTAQQLLQYLMGVYGNGSELGQQGVF